MKSNDDNNNGMVSVDIPDVIEIDGTARTNDIEHGLGDDHFHDNDTKKTIGIINYDGVESNYI